MAEKKIHLGEVIGKGYGAFWECRKRYRVVKGGKGSKKSATASLWYIYNLMRYREANLLVVRAVYATMRDSCFAQLKWAIHRLGVAHLWRAIENPLEITYLPTGQKILFRGFDDVEKLASTTVEKGYLCWVWIEEAFEIRSQADFDKLDLSVPRGDVPAPLFKQTTLTFNPWSEKSWLKARFFDREDPNVFALTTNYLLNEFLDQTDREIYERMRVENPRKYEVAGLGNWGVSEGLIYENWAVEPFDVREMDQSGCRHVFGLDYGYTNDPTAFIAAAVYPEKKALYIYDEHYQKHMMNDAIAAMIRRKGYEKERIRADSAEPKSNDDLRRLGISRIVPARKGRDSIVNGIARIQEYRMVVHPRCVNTIAELSAYCWEKGKADDPVNRPVDADNHLMDALRYAMEDVRLYRPEVERQVQSLEYRRAASRQRRAAGGGSVRAADFRGGWG